MSQHVLERAESHHDGVGELAALLPGKVVLPGDDGWDQQRMGWILTVDQRPVAVVNITDPQDVVTAVKFAIRNGMAVAAQPVGHGATAAVNGTILLRTRGLQEITVDAYARRARVGAGVKWGEALAVIGEYGLTGLAGSSPDPTVVGFSVSGGLSWFGRKYGLAAHSILAVDLVDANGDLRRVTAESDPDLFWAIRGGGGDFGIVTAIEFQLHPAAHVYGGRLMWPIEMARPVLRAFRDISKTAPDELSMWAHLLQFPPIPDVPEPMRGKSFVSIDIAFIGSAEDAEELLMPLRTLPAQWMDNLDTVPLAELGGICQEPVDPMPVSEYSGLLRDFDNDAIEALLRVAGPDSGSPLVIAQVRHLGGALARGTAQDGPSGAVAEPYQLFLLGLPMSPEMAAGIEITIAAAKTELTDYLTGRTFFTFLADDDDPTRAFSAEALQRLQQIKRTVDPNGVMRSNRPVIRPSAQIPEQR